MEWNTLAGRHKHLIRSLFSILFDKRIKIRIIKRFMIIIIGTIFSIGSFSYIYLSKVTENEINSYSDIIIDQISQSFEDSFSGVDSIINLVYNYQVLKDVMEKDIPTSDFERLTLAHQVSDAMLNIAMLRKDIEAITLYTIKNKYVYNYSKTATFDYGKDDFFTQKNWYEKVVNYDGKILVQLENNHSVDQSIVIYKMIKGRDLKKPIGVIRVGLNFDQIKKICKKVEFANNGQIIIFDSSGKVAYNTEVNYLSRHNEKIFSTGSLGNSGKIFKNIDNKRYLVSYYTISDSNWKIIYLIPVSEIYKSVNFLKNITILFGFLLMFITSYISIVFARSFSLPMEKLAEHLKKMNGDDLCLFPFKYDIQDEVGDLINSVNLMIERTNHLIQSEYQSKLLAKDAQLNTLISQINPHFLYNIMENISGIGYSKGIPELSIITENLIEMLRFGLDSKNLIVPLDLEIEHIKKYIEIQNLRFGNGISLEFDIQKEISSVKILKFILQPIVENAVLHGLSEKMYKGTIKISAHSSGRIYIFISMIMALVWSQPSYKN